MNRFIVEPLRAKIFGIESFGSLWNLQEPKRLSWTFPKHKMGCRCSFHWMVHTCKATGMPSICLWYSLPCSDQWFSGMTPNFTVDKARAPASKDTAWQQINFSLFEFASSTPIILWQRNIHPYLCTCVCRKFFVVYILRSTNTLWTAC